MNKFKFLQNDEPVHRTWTIPFTISATNRGKYFNLPVGSQLFCYDIQQNIITRRDEIIYIRDSFADPYSYHCYIVNYFNRQNETVFKCFGLTGVIPILYNINHNVLENCTEYERV
jgi:hypothetical protein